MPLTTEPERPQDRQRDHLFRVVEHAVKLAVDELLGRQLGDEQQVERAGVAFAGKRGHALGVDQDQAQDAERDRDHREQAWRAGIPCLAARLMEERRRRSRRSRHKRP